MTNMSEVVSDAGLGRVSNAGLGHVSDAGLGHVSDAGLGHVSELGHVTWPAVVVEVLLCLCCVLGGLLNSLILLLFARRRSFRTLSNRWDSVRARNEPSRSFRTGFSFRALVSGSWPEVDPCVCRLVLSLSLANLASLLMETLAGAALLLAPGQ